MRKKQLQAVPGGEHLDPGAPRAGLPSASQCWDIRSGVLWSKSFYSTGTSRLFPQPDVGDQAEPLLQQTTDREGVLFLHSGNPNFPITGKEMQQEKGKLEIGEMM